MKLNLEFREYAQHLFQQRHSELVVNRENKVRNARIGIADVDAGINEITNALYEIHREVLLARVESYLSAYRKKLLIIDSEDEREILAELRNLNTTELDFALHSPGLEDHWTPNTNRAIPNVPQYLMNRFEMALSQAAARLRSGSLEIANEPRTTTIDNERSNTIVIHGDNHAQIQQGGSHNAQIFSGKGKYRQ
jgi:hypothetical protein